MEYYLIGGPDDGEIIFTHSESLVVLTKDGNRTRYYAEYIAIGKEQIHFMRYEKLSLYESIERLFKYYTNRDKG
jgi:hypothetical protein